MKKNKGTMQSSKNGKPIEFFQTEWKGELS